MRVNNIKKLDDLGRIVIPKDIRVTLGWDKNTNISVIKSGNKIILQSYENACVFCGKAEKISMLKDKYICDSCLIDLNDMTKK